MSKQYGLGHFVGLEEGIAIGMEKELADKAKLVEAAQSASFWRGLLLGGACMILVFGLIWLIGHISSNPRHKGT